MMGGGAYGGGPRGAAAAPAGNAAHGRQISAPCAACHGADGNSSDPQFPKLAGQNAAYLYSQILAFKTKARPSPVMAPLVANVSEADAADIARFYSEQPIKPDRVTDRALAQEGEGVFGRSGRGSPSCATCHAGTGARMSMMHMMGVNPADIPNLYGQHAAYVVLQLDQYASGARPDGVMNQIAADLSKGERQAVATYLAGLR
jgi:cytochrome c553